jgi:FkbM family methyltransferase
MKYTNFKNLFKIIINYLNRRVNPDSNQIYQVWKVIDFIKAKYVFDIGANKGQFAKELKSVGYNDVIISFEPLSKAHKKLTIAAKKNHNWIVHPQCAVGNENREIEINESENSVSSSILPILNSHTDAAADSKYINKTLVQCIKLDSVIDEYIQGDQKYFIKIDTQGFEWQVIEGADKAISNAEGVMVELSLIPLYENQHLWNEIIDILKNRGFEIWSIHEGFTDDNNGRTLQIDAIFLKNKYLNY